MTVDPHPDAIETGDSGDALPRRGQDIVTTLDTPVFDYHEHHGERYRCTHEHDQHPRHHHDQSGSVYYYRTDDGAPAPVPVARRSDPIGVGGHDISLATGA